MRAQGESPDSPVYCPRRRHCRDLQTETCVLELFNQTESSRILQHGSLGNLMQHSFRGPSNYGSGACATSRKGGPEYSH